MDRPSRRWHPIPALALASAVALAACGGSDRRSAGGAGSSGEEVLVLEAAPGAVSEWLAPASTDRLVPDAPLCPECVIRATTLFTIGAVEGPESLYGLGRMIEDAAGRLWWMESRRVPVLFGADGTYLTDLGTLGPGPGEFMSASPVIEIPGDSMLVFDFVNRRAVVVGPSLAQARTIATGLPFAAAIVVSWPDLLVVENSVGSREPLPRLHTLDLSGPVATNSRIDWDGGRPLPPPPATRFHALAAAADGFWALERRPYLITRWTDPSADPVVWTRDAPWFSTTALEGMANPHGVGQVREDEGGSLWVAIAEPREGSQELVQRALAEVLPAGGGTGAYEVPVAVLPPAHLLYRTVIEVLHPTSPRVFARGTLDEYLIALLPGRRAAAYFEDEAGIPRVSILQLEIVRPAPEGR